MNSDRSFLGTGWSFPPAFTRAIPGVEMVADAQDIRQSLQILLSTQQGERILQHEYGCDLNRILFEPVDATLTTYITDLIKTAILYYEPRIILENVELETSEQMAGIINISLDYLIKTTNSRDNIVFPFYLNEGTDVQQ